VNRASQKELSHARAENEETQPRPEDGKKKKLLTV